MTKPQITKLGLGTIAFATEAGKLILPPSHEEITGMLAYAASQGISYLDTGNSFHETGEGLSVLSRCLDKLRHNERPQAAFQFLASTSLFKPADWIEPQLDALETQLEKILGTLKQETLAGLVVSAWDALTPAQIATVVHRLQHLKKTKRLEKIGFAVFTPEEALKLTDRYAIDAIQLPLNVLDQRFLQTGCLDQLKARHIHVIVRDVYLQGVLMNPTQLHPWFWPIQSHLANYERFLIENTLTPLEGALAFLCSLNAVDTILIAAGTLNPLKEAVIAGQMAIDSQAFGQFALKESRFIDPRCWNLYH
ncbi:MAG: aldo/keto reductase [Cyanobacteria bacterium P01_H01_bin.74]